MILKRQRNRKMEKRLQIIRSYFRELKRKRYAKAHRRFLRIRAAKLDLPNEAMQLISGEIADKDLDRLHYFEPDEPVELVNYYFV